MNRINKFSLSTLLWLICICAMGITVWMTQTALHKKDREIAKSDEQIADYRDRLSEIEIGDRTKYHIRHYVDPYALDSKYRWRIYKPESSTCQIYFAYGVLPKSGMPKNRTKLVHSKIGKGVDEMVLTMGVVSTNGQKGEFKINLMPKVGSEGFFPMQGRTYVSVDWIPSLQKTTVIRVHAPLDITTNFQLDEPFIIMKNYIVKENGDLYGYMFWIEDQSPPSNNVN